MNRVVSYPLALAGAVFALELGDTVSRPVDDKPAGLTDVEGKLAALLGATPADVLVHDMAVNPLSKNVYLAVSRGRALLASEWLLPNDVADASVLVKIDAAQELSVVDLSAVAHARVEPPNPVDPAKKRSTCAAARSASSAPATTRSTWWCTKTRGRRRC